MRHVTLVLILVFTLTLAAPATAAVSAQPEDPVLKILESQPNLGPYCDPNG